MQAVSTPFLEFKSILMDLMKKTANPKMETFADEIFKLNEDQFIKTTPLLQRRVIELGEGRLSSELLGLYRVLLKQNPEQDKSENLSKPLALAKSLADFALEGNYDPSILDIIAEFIATGNITNRLNGDNVLDTYECARELQIKPLEKLCLTYLKDNLKNSLTYANLLKIFYWAEIHQEFSILSTCLYFIKQELGVKNIIKLAPHVKWRKLTSAIVYLIYNGQLELFPSGYKLSCLGPISGITAFQNIISLLRVKELLLEADFELECKQDIEALSFILEKNKTITKLTFFFSSLGDEGANGVADILRQNERIDTLEFEGSLRKDQVITIVKALEENRAIKNLKISSTKIRYNRAQSIAELLRKNQGIRSLNLENCLNDEATKIICEALQKNTNLQSVNLTCGYEHDPFKSHVKKSERLKYVAEVVEQNTSIRKLVLNSINFSDATYAAFISALRLNRSIVEFHFAKNRLNENVITLIEVLKDMPIVYLNLHTNSFTNEVAFRIVDLLKDNKYLKALNLSYNSIDLECAKKMYDVLGQNTTLKEIIMDHCMHSTDEDKELFKKEGKVKIFI